MTDPRRNPPRKRSVNRFRHLRRSSAARSHRRVRTVERVASDGLLTPLRRHRLLTVLGLLVAIVATGTRFVAVGIVPPSISAKPFAHANASTQVVVGKRQSLSYSAPDSYASTLPPRSYALADMVASPEVASDVARAAGVPVSKLGILQPLWTDLSRQQQWANGPKRASQIVIENDPYQISLAVEGNKPPWAPVIDVSTQAPTTRMAAKLATAVTTGLQAYVARLQAQSGVPAAERIAVTPLAPVAVTPTSRSQLLSVAVFTFTAVFALWCFAVVAASSLIRDLRDARTLPKVARPGDRSFYRLQD